MKIPRSMWVIASLAAWVLAAAACSAWAPTIMPPTQGIPTHTPSAQGLPTDTRGQAHVDSIEILVLESFPVQIRALVRGSLPDSCTAIDQIVQAREGNAFRVTITTVRATGQACAQSLVPFEESIPLQVVGLQAGDYTVTVNDISTTFQLSADNVAQTQPEPGRVIVGEAAVSSVDVGPVPGDALPLTVVVRGNLPDGCTRIARVTHTVEGHELRITVTTERPADLMCTEALVPFEQAIPIEVATLPTGTITVIANGVRTSFERP